MNKDGDNMSRSDERSAMRQMQLMRFCLRWVWWGVFLGSLTMWVLIVVVAMAIFWRT